MLARSFQLFFFCAFLLIVLTACPSKQTKPEQAPESNAAATDEDKNIQNQNMSFGAEGSDSGKIDGLFSIHFPYDKSTLDDENRGLLAKDADWMKAHAGKKVQIEGHCDRHGSIEYNMALGERRAKAVKTYLENLGVSGKDLPVISYGKEKMLDTAETDSADAKNRRANFLPVGKK